MGIAAADDHRPGLSRGADRDAAHDVDLGDRTGDPHGLGQTTRYRTPGPYITAYTLHTESTQHHVIITLQNASSTLPSTSLRSSVKWYADTRFFTSAMSRLRSGGLRMSRSAIGMSLRAWAFLTSAWIG